MSTLLGVVGLLLVIGGITIGKHNRRDLFFALGGACMLVYSVEIGQPLYVILLTLFTLASLVHMSAVKHKRQRR